MSRFLYDGIEYEVGPEAEQLSLIRLPCGKTLQVMSWGESCPPTPREFKEVNADDSFEVAVATILGPALMPCPIPMPVPPVQSKIVTEPTGKKAVLTKDGNIVGRQG